MTPIFNQNGDPIYYGPRLLFWLKIGVILRIRSALQAVLSFSAWEKSQYSIPKNNQKLEDM